MFKFQRQSLTCSQHGQINGVVLEFVLKKPSQQFRFRHAVCRSCKIDNHVFAFDTCSTGWCCLPDDILHLQRQFLDSEAKFATLVVGTVLQLQRPQHHVTQQHRGRTPGKVGRSSPSRRQFEFCFDSLAVALD